VHRDLLPIATALSFVATALVAATEHVATWMRRTFALLRRLPPPLLRAASGPGLLVAAPRVLFHCSTGRPRAPPAFS
jgi:hypothetical protein